MIPILKALGQVAMLAAVMYVGHRVFFKTDFTADDFTGAVAFLALITANRKSA